MEHDKPVVIDIPALGATLGRLILSGLPSLIPPVAEYGRITLADQAQPEANRLAVCRAISQPVVRDTYVDIIVLCGDDNTTRASILREAALYVYTRSDNNGR